MEVENKNVLSVDGLDIQWNRKQYRAPFKIHTYCWGPKDDLLALASKKGEVSVKRLPWRKCWKINVANIVDPLANVDQEDTRYVTSMCWNPKGDVLAVGMSDGHLHLVDVDSGAIRWTKVVTGGVPVEDRSLKKLQWSCSHTAEVPKTINGWRNDIWDTESSEVSEEDITRNLPDVDQRSEDINNIIEVEALFDNSLRETILLALATNTISVVAGGLVVIAVIDIAEALSSLELKPSNVYDICYSLKQDSVVAVITSNGPRPHCGGSGTFGVPVTIPGTSHSKHSHVINFPLGETSFFVREHRWRIVSRMLRIHNRLRYLECVITNFTKEWDNKTQIFANRLQPPSTSLNLGNALTAVLLAGVAGPNVESWMERMIGQNVSGLSDYAQQTVRELSKSLCAGLGIAVRSLSFQLDLLNAELEYLLQIESSTSWLNTVSIHSAAENINTYPYSRQLAEISSVDCKLYNKFRELSGSIGELSTRLQQKQQECSVAGVNNMNEICTFVRWLSTFPHILRSRRASTLNVHMMNFDNDMLLKYILNAFLFSNADSMFIQKFSLPFEDNMSEERLPVDHGDDSEPPVQGSSRGNDNHGNKPRHFETRLDKISSYWSQNEVAKETLLMLVNDNELENKSNASLSSLISDSKQVFTKITNSLSQVITVPSPDWLYEIVSDDTHTGFQHVQLTETSWSSNENSKCIIPFNDMEVLDFYKTTGTQMGESFTVTWSNDNEAGSSTIIPKDVRTKDRLMVYSGPVEQMEIRASCGEITVNGKYKLRYESEKMNIAPGTLSIDTLQGPGPNCLLDSINNFEAYADGYFVLSFTCLDQSLGETKRYLVGNCFSHRWVVHDMTIRPEPFESMQFSLNGDKACGLLDGGTSAVLWSTRPPPGEEEEKVKKIDQYRNQDVASAHNSARHLSTNVFQVIDSNCDILNISEPFPSVKLKQYYANTPSK